MLSAPRPMPAVISVDSLTWLSRQGYARAKAATFSRSSWTIRASPSRSTPTSSQTATLSTSSGLAAASRTASDNAASPARTTGRGSSPPRAHAGARERPMFLSICNNRRGARLTKSFESFAPVVLAFVRDFLSSMMSSTCLTPSACEMICVTLVGCVGPTRDDCIAA